MENSGVGPFGPNTYGDSFADVYDAWYHDISDPIATASFVDQRCGHGPVIELGVGTGRLVDAFLANGRRVIGVDASAPMLARCEPRHGLSLIRADLASLPIAKPDAATGGPRIGGAICAFNTLFNLDSETKQATLFSDLRSAVHPDGAIVIEAITGAGLGDGPRDSVGISRIEAEQLVLSATRVDAESQTIVGQHVDITESGGVKLRPWRLRWTTPTQLDAIAKRSGLALAERFADWDEAPFDDESAKHVSVYRPA